MVAGGRASQMSSTSSAEGSTRSTAHLVTLNTRGMRDSASRSRILNACLAAPHDLIFLQETHVASAREGVEWLHQGGPGGSPWPGVGFWAAGPSPHSAGLGLLFPRGSRLSRLSPPRLVFNGEPLESLTSLTPAMLALLRGRLLIVSITLPSGTPVFFVNVHAPSSANDRRDFFNTTNSILTSLIPSHAFLALAGDFNCVESQMFDCAARDPSSPFDRMAGVSALRTITSPRNMVDTWRTHAPFPARLYTRRPSAMARIPTAATTSEASRLDRIYVSAPLLPEASPPPAGLVHTFPHDLSDHLAFGSIIALPGLPTHGPRAWHLPLHLLQDPSFTSGVKSLWAAHLISFGDVHPSPYASSRRARWDSFKVVFRAWAMRWTSRSSWLSNRTRRARLARAHALFAHYSLHPSPLAWSLYLEAASLLEHDTAEHLARASARAGLLMQHLGGAATHWFHSQPLPPPSAPIVEVCTPTQPIPASIAIPSQRSDALARMVEFFSADSPTGLFAQTPHSPAMAHAQSSLLACIDSTFSDNASDACEHPRLPDPTNALDNPSITCEELRDALRRKSGGSSPGPDGIPYEFYKTFWTLFGPELRDVFHETFLVAHSNPTSSAFDPLPSPALASSHRTGIILPFYKKGDATLMSNYRPITLTNSDCKLLSSALVSRWAPHVTSVVDPNQSGFLPGRFIGDNILNHLELIDHLHHHNLPGVMLFLDFHKAFDSIDHAWILKCAAALGFGPRALTWMRALTCGISSSVCTWGWTSPSFPIRRGVRQGDPLSPLLFVIAAQPLAAAMRRQQQLDPALAIPLPNGSTVPIIDQHADDTSLKVVSRAAASTVLTTVDTFCLASGSALNTSKGAQALVFGSARDELPPGDHTVASVLVSVVDDSTPIRHLGILVGHDRDACRTSLYDRIRSRIIAIAHKWAHIPLSRLDRAHVAKQCLVASAVYAFSFVPPSSAQLHDIAALIYSFIDLGCTSHRIPPSCPLRAAQSLPLSHGGIAAPDVHAIATALAARVFIRLVTPAGPPPPPPTAEEASPSASSDALHSYASRETTLASLPWRQLQLQWFTSEAGPVLRDGCMGPRVCFSHLPLSDSAFMGNAPPRVLAYALAAQQLRLHRLFPANTLPPSSVALERVFFNDLFLHDGDPLHPHHGFGATLRAANVSCVGDQALVSNPIFLAAPPFTTNFHLTMPSLSVPPSDPPDWPSQLGFQPREWGFQTHPIGSITCKSATLRIILSRLLRDGAGATSKYHQGSHMLLPRVWDDLVRHRVERSWLTSPRPSTVADFTIDYSALPGSSWLDLASPSAPRLHPLARAASRASTSTAPPPLSYASLLPISHTPIDTLATSSSAPPPSCLAWRILHRARSILPRPIIATAWAMYHMTLPCGARHAPNRAHAFCPTCSTNGLSTPETLSHLLVDCPVAQVIWTWSLSIAAALSPSTPTSPMLECRGNSLLCGIRSTWTPSPVTVWSTWDLVRLVTIHFIHKASQLARLGLSTSPSTTLAAIKSQLRTTISLDWSRVVDGDRFLLSDSHVRAAMARGRSIRPLLLADFQARWCPGDSTALCSVFPSSNIDVHPHTMTLAPSLSSES